MKLDLAVTKNLGSFRLDAGFSLEGQRIGLFGRSGSGKSTLVSILAGLVQPDSGSVAIDGALLTCRDRNISIPPEQRRIAIVFQHPHLFPHMNVKGNLQYGYKRCKPEHRKVDFDTLVEVLQLKGLLSRGVENLSGGEKQRVAIGRAVLSNPRLLIMDEPLSALDDTLKFQIMPFLRNTCEQFGIPFLYISHSLIEMRLMTDTVVVLKGGRVVQTTTPDSLALDRMGKSQVGYINILRLDRPRQREALYAYPWGSGELILSEEGSWEGSLFELSSKDIILFKKNPEAISARNLLKCKVTRTFGSGNKTGAELSCGGDRLVAEVASEAAVELGIERGVEVYAAIKASAFRKLG